MSVHSDSLCTLMLWPAHTQCVFFKHFLAQFGPKSVDVIWCILNVDDDSLTSTVRDEQKTQSNNVVYLSSSCCHFQFWLAQLETNKRHSQTTSCTSALAVANYQFTGNHLTALSKTVMDLSLAEVCQTANSLPRLLDECECCVFRWSSGRLRLHSNNRQSWTRCNGNAVRVWPPEKEKVSRILLRILYFSVA